jgi:hypothetical protein
MASRSGRFGGWASEGLFLLLRWHRKYTPIWVGMAASIFLCCIIARFDMVQAPRHWESGDEDQRSGTTII